MFAGEILVVDCFEAGVFNVGIDLGGGNAGMPKHGLYGPQIRSMIQQMGRERMPEHMWRDGLGNPGSSRAIFKHFPKILPTHGPTQPGEKQRRRRPFFDKARTSGLQILRNQFACLIADRHNSLLIALAGRLQKPHF